MIFPFQFRTSYQYNLPSPARILEIRVDFPSSRHDIRTEYIVYDADSFIADVGGFLGLLLGYSAFGLLQMASEYVGKARGAKWVEQLAKVGSARKY